MLESEAQRIEDQDIEEPTDGGDVDDSTDGEEEDDLLGEEDDLPEENTDESND